jgi:hypothetical protein
METQTTETKKPGRPKKEISCGEEFRGRAETQTTGPTKVLAKVVQFYKGVELMGSVFTVNHTRAEIEVTPIGVKITSKKVNKQGITRCVLVPWANVVACELL